MTPLASGILPAIPFPWCAADNVYITNLDDQNTLQFVEELQRRLHATAVAASEAATNGMFASQSEMSLGGAGEAAGLSRVWLVASADHECT